MFSITNTGLLGCAGGGIRRGARPRPARPGRPRSVGEPALATDATRAGVHRRLWVWDRQPGRAPGARRLPAPGLGPVGPDGRRRDTQGGKLGGPIVIEQGDAASPPYAPASCDVVLARHVLWALPDLGAALLRPSGRLILIEGRWSTGAGLAAADCQELLLQHRQEADVKRLDDPTLWGRQINDERYLVLSRR